MAPLSHNMVADSSVTTEAGLTVAVTGPTGDIGRSLMRALDREPLVDRVVGMARRPFDPHRAGYKKVDYLQGDITDRDAVECLVRDADVVVHLAFVIFGSPESSRHVNLHGSRNVFEATLNGRARRLIYTSSVAAYGFHADNPDRLTEDVPTRGTDSQPYSRQKADVERLLDNLAAHSSTDVYVFRPCIVAGPTALSLISEMPYVKLAAKLPGRAQRLLGDLPLIRPVIPDPGVVFQLVHEDDVAEALRLATLGRGEPETYNLAAEGAVDIAELARALGWYSVPVPDLAVKSAAAIVSRMPLLPVQASWINAVRVPVMMDTTRATTRLGWTPRKHARETLAETVAAARARGLLPWPARGLS